MILNYLPARAKVLKWNETRFLRNNEQRVIFRATLKQEKTMDERDWKTADRMQNALAITHHVQNRIVQCIGRGEVSETVAEDVAQLCKAIAQTFAHAAAPTTQEAP